MHDAHSRFLPLEWLRGGEKPKSLLLFSVGLETRALPRERVRSLIAKLALRCGGASIIGLVALTGLAGCLLKGGSRPGAVFMLPQS